MNTIEMAMARADAMRASWAAEARTVPSIRTTTLTPHGRAVVAALRLGRALAELENPIEQLRVATLATTEAVRLLDEAEAQPA